MATWMKTIYIKADISPGDERSLMRELYETGLRADPCSHFFWEARGVIVRMTKKACLVPIDQYLKAQNLDYAIYDYPNSGDEYNETPFVAEHLDLFLPLFHAHSVAAITLTDQEFLDYLERTIHTAFSPRFLGGDVEGSSLIQLGQARINRIQQLKRSSQ